MSPVGFERSSHDLGSKGSSGWPHSRQPLVLYQCLIEVSVSDREIMSGDRDICPDRDFYVRDRDFCVQ